MAVKTVVDNNAAERAIDSHPLVKMYQMQIEGVRAINWRYEARVTNLQGKRDEALEGNKSSTIARMAEMLADDNTKEGKNMKDVMLKINIGGSMLAWQRRSDSVPVSIQTLGRSGLIESAADVRVIQFTEMGKGVAKLLFAKQDVKPIGSSLRSGALHEADNNIVVQEFEHGKLISTDRLPMPPVIRK